jgi:hypothetical protein
MSKFITRRDFLKLGAVSLGALGAIAAGTPFPWPKDGAEYPTGLVGRVAVHSISVFSEPDAESETVGYRFFNDLLNIYYEVESDKKPKSNPLWYRVWGGYVHSGYIQRAKVRFNTPLSTVSEAGQLVEVTVPYTQVYRYDRWDGWQPKNTLYYMTTHWAVGIDRGPDGQPWYRLFDELLRIEYHAPAIHFRAYSDEEIAPLSPDVPWEAKRIQVSLGRQILTAYEYDQIVLETSISSGLPWPVREGQIPTATPTGKFNVQSKMPSKHMGDGQLTGSPDAYTLPGVPWTVFFLTPPGYAFHGTFWHNNFGTQMSHGCVNMRTEEARWLFRWTDPKFQYPLKDRGGWERNGYGTQISITA